ncbi:ABC transporter ATP-binding protein [Rhizobium leguminosarum]|nr:ABC transporter ATP-binding protein [Rhizobium leguminosarum]
MLQVRNLHGWYGKSHVLQGLDFDVQHGETVALLGRNGVGKTTTMKALTGLLRRREGDVSFDGRATSGLPVHALAAMGLSLVPEDRGIFSTLTVEENLRLAARKGARWTVREVFSMFPAIERRRKNIGGKLSGGEQQLLSIGRALVTGPKLLLLDEPTEGLAPIIVDRLVELIIELKRAGLSILLVEQSIDVCLALADRLLVLDHGQIVWRGTGPELLAAEEVRNTYITLETA